MSYVRYLMISELVTLKTHKWKSAHKTVFFFPQVTPLLPRYMVTGGRILTTIFNWVSVQQESSLLKSMTMKSMPGITQDMRSSWLLGV